nr:hypothetical protein [uncultured Rhodoferax sp.]
MFLILFVGLPVLVSVLVPRPWVRAFAATLCLVWLVMGIDFSRTRGGNAEMMGMVLLSALIQLMLLVLGLRYLFAWRKKPPVLFGWSYRWAQTYMVGLAALVGAVLLMALWVQVCNAVFQSGLLTHFAVAVLMLAWWVLLPRLWRGSLSDAVGSLHPANVSRWVGAAVMLAALTWSMVSAQRVAQAAQVAAQGQAYCLLSATESGLQPVTRLLDLAGFSLQAGRGAMRHGQLATGSVHAPFWAYWSYRESGFVTDAMGGVLTCDLQPHYAAKLPWWTSDHAVQASAASRESNFWLAGVQWRIPQAYKAQASDKPASLDFYASSKDFGPPTGTLVRSGPQPWSQIAQSVNVTLCAPKKIHPRYELGDAQNQVRTVSVNQGLAKQEIVTAANQVPRYQYVEQDAKGAPVTWLACDGPDASCNHAFVREGMYIRFVHAAADVPNWKSLQDALWQRIRTFAVTWPDAAMRQCAN